MNKTFILLGLLFITVPILADIDVCPTFTGIKCAGTCRRIANCTNCGTVGGNEVCTACVSGFYPNGLSTACVRGCIQATGETLCTACSYDNTLVRTKCTACKAGNGLNALNQCVTCSIDNCGSCSVDVKDVQTCSACKTGFFANPEKTSCTACSLNCNECTDAATCTSCASGFYIKDKACSTCDQLTPKCATCNNVDGTCLTCTTEYTKGSDNKCYLKIANCLQYNAPANNTITCQTCADNFVINDVNTKCTAGNVANCKTYTTNTDTCIACNTSFYLLTTATPATCAQCLANCNVCPDVKSCTTCKDGYYYDTTDAAKPACVQCSQKMANCLTCKTATVCDVCEYSYYGATTSKCQKCAILNCKICSNDVQTCTECSDGFYGNTKAQCTSCTVANCATCPTAAETCATCKNGYQLKDNVCILNTIPNCDIQTSNTSCSQCSTGFKKSLNNGDVCVACGNVIPGCADCDWNTQYDNNVLVCNNCTSRYTLVNQVCVPCPFGCSNCTITTVNSAGAVILADEGLVLATTVTNSYTPYTQAISCDACLSGYATQNSNSNQVYCAKSSSSYLLFALVQLILVAFLLF